MRAPLRRFASLTPLLLAGLLGCGGGTHHLYPGPEQPVTQLAKLDCYRSGTTVELLAVDGRPSPPNYVFLQPGLHRIKLAGPPNISAADKPPDELVADPDARRPVLSVDLELAAGEQYYLGATLGELAFLKIRSDQTRVWEEGFYKTWTLDFYGQPQGAIGLPALIRSFPQTAE